MKKQRNLLNNQKTIKKIVGFALARPGEVQKNHAQGPMSRKSQKLQLFQKIIFNNVGKFEEILENKKGNLLKNQSKEINGFALARPGDVLKNHKQSHEKH